MPRYVFEATKTIVFSCTATDPKEALVELNADLYSDDEWHNAEAVVRLIDVEEPEL